MTQKDYKGHGMSSLSPEFGEITRRLKRKEPELDELVARAGESRPTNELEGENDDSKTDAGRD